MKRTKSKLFIIISVIFLLIMTSYSSFALDDEGGQIEALNGQALYEGKVEDKPELSKTETAPTFESEPITEDKQLAKDKESLKISVEKDKAELIGASVAEKAITLFENGNKVGDFDTLKEAIEKTLTFGDGNWGAQHNFNFKFQINKDLEISELAMFGWALGEAVVTSKDPANPRTIRANQLNHPHMISVVQGAKVRFENIILDGNNESGLLYVEAGTSDPNYVALPAEIIIDNGAILQNGKKKNGGAIFAQRLGKITINGGEIRNNVGTGAGGAICNIGREMVTINGGKIYGNQSPFGGGVYLQGNGTMTGGEIFGNSSTNGAGIATGKGVTFAMTGGKIHKNIAGGKGGGIYSFGNSIITIDGGELSENQADYGGGAYISGDSKFTLNGGSVLANVANRNGGGLYPIGNKVTCLINGGIIGQNQANFGGGIFNASTNTKIDGGNIQGNIGRMKGGGVYLSQPCQMMNTTIVGNTAAHGGGICQKIPESANMAMNNIEFRENHGILLGGGMLIERGGLDVSNSVFNGNVAENESVLTPEEQSAPPENTNRRGSGGGVYAVTNPDSIKFTDTGFSNNKAYYGGGIWTGTEMNISRCQFMENSAYVIKDENETLQNQGHGGGIFVNVTLPKEKTVTITSSTFQNNNAAKSGGAISIDETNGLVKIAENTKFENNYTTGVWGHGGAIYSNLHAYIPEYNDGTTGGLIQPPTPNDFYSNVETDDTTVFTGNKAYRTFTPPVTKNKFINLMFKSTSHPNTKYDHILNNDDVNLKNFLKVIFDKNYGEEDNIHQIYLVIEKNLFGDQYPEAPVRKGYVFKGWNTKSDGSGEFIDREELKKLVIQKNHVFYAIWELEDNTETPEISGKPEDSENPPVVEKPDLSVGKVDSLNKESMNKMKVSPATGDSFDMAIIGLILIISEVLTLSMLIIRRKGI